MDTLPPTNTPIDSPKSKPMKTKKIDEPTIAASLTDATSSMVAFLPQRTSTAKSGGAAKKSTESTKKLRKKLNEIAEENETLAKQINDKNHEIEELKRSVQSLNDVLESVPLDQMRADTSIAARQILELSKKNRQYRTELESKRTLITKRDLQIQKLQKELETLKEKQEQETGFAKEGGKALAELQTKLNSLQQKWFETRNKNIELQEKLKLAGKCLQQEIGDSFDLSKLHSLASQSGSQWRGRAQLILSLQQTIGELKARIQILEEMAVPSDIINFTYEQLQLDAMSVNSTLAPKNETPKSSSQHRAAKSTRSVKSAISFDRFTPSVRKNEIEHRAKVEELEKTIVNLKAQIEEQRGKILALKVRNKTLNEDILKYKTKANTLAECTDFNGMNLNKMNEQVLQQKQDYENRIDLMNRELKELRQRCEDVKIHEEELEAKLANAEEMLAQRDLNLAEAQETIRKLEQDMKSICGDFLFSCRELRKEEFVAILDSLETEKNFLLEQTRTLNERLMEERAKSENINDALGKQKIRNARLEGRIRDLEKEIESSGEKKKRLQRISEYASNLNIKNGSIGSFSFENTSRSSTSSTNCAAEEHTPQVRELKQQLEIANEKIAMLEDRLTYLNNEKENDAKCFQEAITNSKTAILDTILTYRGDQQHQQPMNQHSISAICLNAHSS